MPPLPAAGPIVKVVLRGFIDALLQRVWENVFHVKYSGPPPASHDCAVLANDIGIAWGSHIASLCPTPTTLTDITVTDLSSDMGAVGEQGFSTAGTRGDDSIPANASVLVSYPQARRYRGGHPRTYLFVLGNADLLGAGEWADAAVAEVTTKFKAWFADWTMTTSGATTFETPVMVSYYSKELNPVAPYRRAVPFVEDLDYTLMQVHPQMASQRRRIGRPS